MVKVFNFVCWIAVKAMVWLSIPALISAWLSLIGFDWRAIIIAWVVLIIAILIVAYKMDWWSLSPDRAGPCQDCQTEGNMEVAGGINFCKSCGKMNN